MVGVPTFSGILFAEISSKARFLEMAACRSIIKRICAFTLVAFGTYLLSFPSQNWQWYPHFKFIWNDLAFILPPGANVFVDTLNFAILLIMVGLALSPTFQWLLRHRVLLWLGEVSLPIYLLHGPLLRSAFMWIAFAGIYPEYEEQPGADGQPSKVLQPIGDPSPTRTAIALPIWFVLTMLLARLWTKTVEVWCASAVKSLEDIAVGKKELLLRFRVGIAESESQEVTQASS
jgi:peptidoglycan/LPS O-acetylase OafA/YrhL